MKKKYWCGQLLMMTNQLCLFAFLLIEYHQGLDGGTESILPLTVISLTILGAVITQLKNQKGSLFLSHFVLVLITLSWTLLLLRVPASLTQLLGFLLYALLPWLLTRFTLIFIFQDSFYKGRRTLSIILPFFSVLTALFIVNRPLYNLLFLFVCLCSVFSFCIVLFFNRDRITFFLSQEYKNLLKSLALIVLPASLYIFLFQNSPLFLENIGLYLITLLPLYSVHTIIKNSAKTETYPRYFALFLVLLSTTAIILTALFLKLPILAIFILLHLALLLVMVFTAFCQHFFTMSNKAFGSNTLTFLNREESLKTSFSIYLHDHVLQNLLSIKNLMQKSQDPKINQLIIKTLTSLNTSIRSEMQIYHPVLLPSLSLKENYQQLLASVTNMYPGDTPSLNFDCLDSLFLIEPYNRIVARILRELVNNAFKYAKARTINVSLMLIQNTIFLKVWDDGKGFSENTTILNRQGGLTRISETLHLMGGTITLSDNGTPASVTIQIPMKGEHSYEHFID